MGVDELQVGMRFLAETDQGPVPVEITEVEDDHVVVDGNHMLAGQNLKFNVEVVAIREATAEELEHGHVHGAHGHDHDHDHGHDGCCGGHGHDHGHDHGKGGCGGATVAAAATNLCASARRRQKKAGKPAFFTPQ